ncbi:MAG: hypothetical protein BWY32_01530 [bacterium ADurb.Bin243]|nr:MAG: hypothetical protein BWY32_01530 [bacterium ADurb.Bin243]HOD40762.1 hypothetical protein [Candidatus Wallbacteria bacterium]
MDILTAKANIESGDLTSLKESVDFLKDQGTGEHIEPLKQLRLKLPIYETVLLEKIDSAIGAITARAVKENLPKDEQDSIIPPSTSPASENAPDGAFPPSENGRENASQESRQDENFNSNGSAKPGDFPQNEYLDKVKDIWEKGKSAAIKNATLIKLKSQLNTIKNDKIVQLKHLGETAHSCFMEKSSGIPFIDEGIANINDIDQKISKKQAEEKEIEDSRAEGGFWNVVKSSISKFAGYTKIKLDISILQSNRESKLSALGQLIYDRLNECEAVLITYAPLGDVLATIKDLDRQREEKESEIAETSQSE